jgi:hypothetical protein
MCGSAKRKRSGGSCGRPAALSIAKDDTMQIEMWPIDRVKEYDRKAARLTLRRYPWRTWPES